MHDLFPCHRPLKTCLSESLFQRYAPFINAAAVFAGPAIPGAHCSHCPLSMPRARRRSCPGTTSEAPVVGRGPQSAHRRSAGGSAWRLVHLQLCPSSVRSTPCEDTNFGEILDGGCILHLIRWKSKMLRPPKGSPAALVVRRKNPWHWCAKHPHLTALRSARGQPAHGATRAERFALRGGEHSARAPSQRSGASPGSPLGFRTPSQSTELSAWTARELRRLFSGWVRVQTYRPDK